MTHSVHQHWDPLKVCAVGRSFPPEFYSKIGNSKVRSVMERIAIETEEDYQKLINILEKFNVKVDKIATLNFKGKLKNTTVKSNGRVLRTSGFRSSWKKAIITLAEGFTIDILNSDVN